MDSEYEPGAPLPLSHISIVSLLGEGSFGAVYKAENFMGIDNWVPSLYYNAIEVVNKDAVGRERLQPRVVAGETPRGPTYRTTMTKISKTPPFSCW
jgi:hypothetical protein